MAYRHTQIGKLIIVSLTVVALAMTVGFALAGRGVLAFAAGALLLSITILFSSLTVEVDSRQVRLRFGPGPIGKSVPVDRIRGARAVRNSWWHGWGIHLTPDGWVYNVSGFDAVEIELEGGKKLRIGTDEPRRLEDAVRKAAGIG